MDGARIDKLNDAGNGDRRRQGNPEGVPDVAPGSADASHRNAIPMIRSMEAVVSCARLGEAIGRARRHSTTSEPDA